MFNAAMLLLTNSNPTTWTNYYYSIDYYYSIIYDIATLITQKTDYVVYTKLKDIQIQEENNSIIMSYSNSLLPFFGYDIKLHYKQDMNCKALEENIVLILNNHFNFKDDNTYYHLLGDYYLAIKDKNLDMTKLLLKINNGHKTLYVPLDIELSFNNNKDIVVTYKYNEADDFEINLSNQCIKRDMYHELQRQFSYGVFSLEPLQFNGNIFVDIMFSALKYNIYINAVFIIFISLIVIIICYVIIFYMINFKNKKLPKIIKESIKASMKIKGYSNDNINKYVTSNFNNLFQYLRFNGKHFNFNFTVQKETISAEDLNIAMINMISIIQKEINFLKVNHLYQDHIDALLKVLNNYIAVIRPSSSYFNFNEKYFFVNNKAITKQVLIKNRISKTGKIFIVVFLISSICLTLKVLIQG